MRGEPVPTQPRATVLDRADPRVPTVHPPKLTPDQLRVITREGATDPRLRPVDRCLQRWSVTPVTQGAPGRGGSWPHIAQVRFSVSGHISQPSPLPDRETHLVDVAISSSPSWAARFVQLWYRSDFTAQEIAEIIGTRRRQAVYEERHLVLAYYLGRLSQMGLQLTSLPAEA